VTIGRHGSPWTPDTARREARRLLGLVAEGTDPAAAKAQARIAAIDTLQGVLERYLKHAKQKQKPRTYLETERHLLVGWKPLHSIPVAEVQRRHIAARLADLTDASHARAALSACFNWAIGEGLAEANPVSGTNRPQAHSRDRVLADEELVAIWKACRDDDYGRIVRLLLLTGQRRDEVAGLPGPNSTSTVECGPSPALGRRTIDPMRFRSPQRCWG
jgi:integrase